jgi:hypothetical protein
VFSLWSAVCGCSLTEPRRLNQVFVHSKVLLVDDEWATVGSANLDGVSLHSYGADFASMAGERIFRHVRNIDVNIVLDASDGALGGTLRALRERLWREHLGLKAAQVAQGPQIGWLARWRARAARNVAALANGHHDMSGFVLPYSDQSTPAKQLADLGIGAGCVHLEFDPSWVEVHCSPNWIRNMFA